MVRAYRAKRVLDVVVLLLTAVPVAIVGLVCAAAVKLTSSGPILFRQARVGLDGEPFVAIKFRSMIDADNPLIPDDDRITSAGRWLRRTSLDELPQLWNVARGEMSIVGPRPTLAEQVALYDDRQRLRLAVKPGMTGLAQIRGRNELRWADRIEHDLEYVQTQSLRTDLRILVATVGVVLSGHGVEGHPADDPFLQALTPPDPPPAGPRPGSGLGSDAGLDPDPGG